MEGTPWTFEAIGTHWQIVLPELTPDIQALITKRIQEYDANYSRFRADSLVSKMAREAGTYTLPDDAKPLFDLYHKLYELTDHKFTPLIGRVLEDAGYDAEYSLQSKPLTRAVLWDEALEYQFPLLTVKEPALLDLGAAGKGYLVDIVADILVKENVSSFVINAGGDIRIKSETPERIGLEHPAQPGEVIGVVELRDGSICGSAGNRRAWGEYHHIIDPETLLSPRHIHGLWVTAETALHADALTTCLFFTAPEILQAHFAFEYLIVFQDYSFEKSANFPAELFTEA